MNKKLKVKYFICALGTPGEAERPQAAGQFFPSETVNLGIPEERIERIIPVTRLQTNVYETENQDAFISLPALFRQKDAPHGLVLKPGTAAGKRPGKTILLTPKIDIDLEIPEEDIRRLPEAFTGLFGFFRGACFTGPDMILILDLNKLLERYL